MCLNGACLVSQVVCVILQLEVFSLSTLGVAIKVMVLNRETFVDD